MTALTLAGCRCRHGMRPCLRTGVASCCSAARRRGSGRRAERATARCRAQRPRARAHRRPSGNGVRPTVTGCLCTHGPNQVCALHSPRPSTQICSEAGRFDSRVVGSAREGSDGDEGLGSLEEEGELRARSPGRGPLRSLQVHVSTTGARRLSLGPRADPRLGHLRQVHAPPLTAPTGSDRDRGRGRGGPDLCRTIARSLAHRVRRRHRITSPGGWAADPRMNCAIGVSPLRNDSRAFV